MTDPARHPLFTEWTDPESGVKSYLLTEKAAPLQQSFYFTNSSFSSDERYLWFYAAFPPSPYRLLGVLDMEAATVRVFPETAFLDASPLVTPQGDGVYYFQGSGVWLFRIGHAPEPVFELDKDYIAGRYLFRGATHLTLSADGSKMLLDGQAGNQWFVATGDMQTGKVEVINEFPRMYNHAQFSPVDPKLFSMAQDWWVDPLTGRYTFFDQRIWVMDTDRTFCYPIMPKEWALHGSEPCHEWWSRDGKLCWTDYKAGAFCFDVKTEEKTHIWKRPLCHTHCDSSRRFWCADQSPYAWPEKLCQVLFYDSASGKETQIASALPAPPWARGAYHIDPHPQFSPSDRFVVYTTTAAKGVTVALCPTEQFV